MPYHDERLWVPWWWWPIGAGMVLAVFVAYVVWTPLWVTGAVTLTLTAALVVGLLRYGSARVRVDEAGLRAGQATLPREAIGEVRTVDASARRSILGPGADARARTLVRGYVPGGVYVQVVGIARDARSAPYWFVSSRRPGALADALTRVARTAP
jgi:Protein of unknown function (DUF3093)